MATWQGVDSELCGFVRAHSAQRLASYQRLIGDISEHAAIEQGIVDGGYGHRQLFELIQNAADAIADGGRPGRIEVVLTESALYCANEGSPMSLEGAGAILASHMSTKRGHEIGHFGQGFKSVLGVSPRVGIFSQPGSFGFDADDSRRQILREVPGYSGKTPTLRLGQPLDPSLEASADPILRSLMRWATTVVRLSDIRGRASSLPDDLKSFPGQFLLFSPHVTELKFAHEPAAWGRTIQLGVDDRQEITLIDGQPSKWRVFRDYHPMSSKAKLDAGEATARDQVEIAWAVPVVRQREPGRFWAFFPTTYETTLSGILNAPWKTNSDRQGLLEGLYNEEILDAAADLVARRLTELVQPGDQGAHLDALPSRLDDNKNWADRRLNERIYTLASGREVLPDAYGRLRRPSDLRLLPSAATPQAKELWDRLLSVERAGWVHTAVTSRERRPRAERLGALESTSRSWLEHIAADDQPDSSIAALRVAALCEKDQKVWPNQPAGLGAAIVLTSTSRRVPPDADRVFLSGMDPVDVPDIELVHLAVEADDAARTIMKESFGLQEVSPTVAYKVLSGRASRPGFDRWESLWALFRRLNAQEAAAERDLHRSVLKVRTVAGGWKPLWAVLLPGQVITGDGFDEPDVAVDLEFHGPDTGLLRSLGVTATPSATGLDGVEYAAGSQGTWQGRFRASGRAAYQDRCRQEVGKAPAWDSIECTVEPTSGPLSPFSLLSRRAQQRFIEALLPVAAKDRPVLWSAHTRQRNNYRPVSADSPAQWLIRDHGLLRTSLGWQPLADAASATLDLFRELLPVAPRDAEFLRLPATLKAVSEGSMQRAYARALDAEELVAIRLYCQAARDGCAAPATILALGPEGRTAHPPHDVFVTSIQAVATQFQEKGPVLKVTTEEDAAVLAARWGLQVPRTEVTLHHRPYGPAISFAELLPGLPEGLVQTVESLGVQPCISLWKEYRSRHGIASVDLDQAWDADTNSFFYTGELDGLNLLRAARDEAGLGLSDGDIQVALKRRATTLQARRVQEIAAAIGLDTKLALLLEPAALRELLPEQVVASLEAHDSPAALARMVLAIRGSATLQDAKDALRDEGFGPPYRWAGSDAALRFVRELGFPDAFAGMPRSEQPPYIEVDGPLTLPSLHDFQEQVATRITTFVGEHPPRRGLLSLPTGAGKTRVATEALTRAYRGGRFAGLVVWLADRQELCEQAVQSWREVWRSVGPEAPLRISRLWGRNNDSVEGVREKHHVVVATFQSLDSRMERADFHWLNQAGCIVIDEAHGSISPSYTRILNHFGQTPRETSRPLLGLTATPFRGRDIEEGSETERLVRRYGASRFDHDLFPDDDPYPLLRRLEVLAEAEFQTLPGASIDLSQSQLARLTQLRVLPSDAADELGRDPQRNQAIVDAVRGLPSDWPILVFAASVAHAELLAAQLARGGIRARSITSKSDDSARRTAIVEFKSGEVQILTNYGVLTTGFDAPKTRAIIVARPIYSPGLYMQVVGRGLRGPANGGTDTCLIMNVEDNIMQYGEQLAFREFEVLWRQVRGDHF